VIQERKKAIDPGIRFELSPERVAKYKKKINLNIRGRGRHGINAGGPKKKEDKEASERRVEARRSFGEAPKTEKFQLR